MTPAIYNLGDFAIAGAVTNQAGTATTELEGAQAMTISCRLAYGSGGTTVVARVQTSLNQGASWVDVARFDFTTSGDEKIVNLSALTPRTTPLSVADLGSEGCNDGVFGDRLRVKYTTTGTYAGSTILSVRASIR